MSKCHKGLLQADLPLRLLTLGNIDSFQSWLRTDDNHV